MEKLRNEQRKLWRKTFHQDRDRGIAPDIAAQNADMAVREWEARGAFDEDQSPFRPPASVILPGSITEAHWAVQLLGIANHVAVAYSRERDGYALIGLTETGNVLVQVALERGLEAMLKSVADTADMPRAEPMPSLKP